MSDLEQRLAASTTELARAKQQLERLTLDDELTRLRNLRGFLLLAEQVRKVTRRNWQTASLICCDLDGLTAHNESAGREAGDAMLRATADLLRETFREEDIVARIGGDRFAVFAPSPPERAQSVHHRLRSGSAQINKRAELPGELSISVGFASVSPSDERPLEDLLAVADERRREDKLSKDAA